MAGDLAAEHASLLAHARLEERMPDAVDERGAARGRDRVGDRARGAHVVEDVRAGVRLQHRAREQRAEEVAVDELPAAVDEEAAVGVAVPGDAEVGALGAHLVDHEAAVLGQQRVGLVVGELAVGLPVGRDQLEPADPLEDRPDHRPRHPVAAVEHDLERPDRRGVDERQRPLGELAVDVDLLDAPGRAGGVAEPLGHERADVADPRVARQRERALAHELRPRVRLRVVRRRAHQPAVERARADEEVEHLGPDHPRVEHVRALGDHPVAVARRQLRRGQAHVAAEADPQLARGLAAQPGEHARERAADLLGHVAVDLLAVQAADVVGLEDLLRDGGRHGGRG